MKEEVTCGALEGRSIRERESRGGDRDALSSFRFTSEDKPEEVRGGQRWKERPAETLERGEDSLRGFI